MISRRGCKTIYACTSALDSNGSYSSSSSSSSSLPYNRSASSSPNVTAVAPSPASNSSASSSSNVTAVAPSPASNSSASSSSNVTAVAPSPASNSSPIPLSLSSPGISSGAVAIFTSFVAVVAVALVIAVLITKYIRKKKLKTDVEPAPLNSIASGDPKNFKDDEELTPKNSKASTETFPDKIPKEKPASFTPQDLGVFTRNNSEKLGCGGFGVVYKGEFPNEIGAESALKNSMDEEASTPKNSKDEEAESTLEGSKAEEAESSLKNSKDEGASTESSLDKIPKEKPKRFTPQDLEVFTRNNAVRLGSGGFGVVYKGEFPDGIPFAVKILNKDLGKRVEDQFIVEVNTLSRTNHVNLVRLHGYCSDPEMKALVYEYMHNGSLDGYLDGRKAKIEWRKLYEIAVGTAKGIRYLHEECEKKIIHYDIKPANILLSKDFSPKVADFGLAEMFDRENTISTITGGKGTPGFVAPEVWESAVLTRKSDVYSFGKVLFEMLWSTWNSEFMQAESKARFPDWVREMDERNELESVISHCGDEEDRMKTEAMCKVALQCVQRDPKKRPSMSEVVEMLLLWNKKMDAPVYPFNSIVPIDADSEIGK